jgi:tripartite-type tricarboxylate transporter receptor subunit TctC
MRTKTRYAKHSRPDTRYPSRPMRLIVPFAAGGGTDIIARLAAQGLSEAWGQSVVVDNRTGAGGAIGVGLVADSMPNGSTLLLASSGPLTFMPALSSKVPYDVDKDLEPVSMVASQPFVLIASNASGIRAVKELIAAAKAQPGKVVYGSGGNGSASHLGTELLQTLAGIWLQHVPYKGTTPTFAAALSGEVQIAMGAISTAIPLLKGGRAQALAVSGAKRSPLLPDVPSMQEAGVPGYQFDVWYGIAVPAGVPRGIVNRISGEIAKLAQQPKIRERFSSGGMEAVSNTPDEFSTLIRQEGQRWKKIAASANIRLD